MRDTCKQVALLLPRDLRESHELARRSLPVKTAWRSGSATLSDCRTGVGPGFDPRCGLFLVDGLLFLTDFLCIC